jgi:histidinol phosphatase-like enzyme
MKVIFLDIDGVLNSSHYFQTRTSKDIDIDVTRLPLLKRLIDETEANIVLSSS